MYEEFKNSVLGKHVGSGQCVALVNSYAQKLFPNVSWSITLGTPHSAKDLFNSANSKYFQKVLNNHSIRTIYT